MEKQEIEALSASLSSLAQGQKDLAAALAGIRGPGLAFGQKEPPGAPVVPPWYGQQGLFGYQESDVLINASVNDIGIGGWLNWYGSIYRNREQGLLTQMSKKEDITQTTPCSECPSYDFKGCTMSWCFGRICADTPELLADDMGVRPSVQYPIRRWYGGVPGGGPQGSVIGRDDEWAMVMAAHALRGHQAQMMWPGNPVNNSAGGGYAEFKGLDLLVNTGYVDVWTGVTCNAADSEVKAFNRQLLCNASNTNVWTIYQYMVSMYRTIQYRAMTGLGSPINPMDMVWVSAPEIIDCIVDCLACTYYPCVTGAGLHVDTELVIDAARAAEFRDRMYAGQVFHIDGVDIPWIKDPFVTKETGLRFGDETCADLFLLTRRHGPMELTFGEYQDMNQAPDETMFGRPTNGNLFTTDGGRFLGVVEWLKWCTQASLLLKPRVITLAPWLNGRLTDVCCRSPQHYPSPEPASPYFVDGGHGSPLGKSLYDACADEDLTPR